MKAARGFERRLKSLESPEASALFFESSRPRGAESQ